MRFEAFIKLTRFIIPILLFLRWFSSILLVFVVASKCAGTFIYFLPTIHIDVPLSRCSNSIIHNIILLSLHHNREGNDNRKKEEEKIANDNNNKEIEHKHTKVIIQSGIIVIGVHVW